MNESKMINERGDKTILKYKFYLRFFVGIVLLVSSLLYWWHYNPLPSDEEMIAHFHEHRAEIEELVKRYRGCVTKVGTTCEDLPENLALMEKAKVKRVVNNAPVWHPNPYSREAAKQFDDLLSTGKIPSLNPYSSIVVELLDQNHPTRHFTGVLTSSGPRLVFKDINFIPEIVRIEGESLLLAVSPLCNCRFDEITAKLRIFPSLDTYPTRWIKGECVYRQFETHWFIRLCAAAV